MRCYCTYFDHNYLPRGLALHESMLRHCGEFQLWVLCLSDLAFDVMTRLSLPSVRLIRLADFESGDGPLLNAKQDRSIYEYYFTCTPSLPLYVLRHCPEADLVTYIDCDMFFYSDPQTVFDEIAGHSIVIIEHRFPPALKAWEINGKYNVGWVSFRRDENGMACLKWWRERCLEWCKDRIEGDRFADQKYLEKWPALFRNLLVLQHKGCNTAPYNLANYQVRLERGKVWIDQDPLVVFHFHGFNQIAPFLYDPYFHNYKVGMTKALREGICGPYTQAYHQARKQVQPFLAGKTPRFKTRSRNRRISWRRPHKFLYNEYLILTDRIKHFAAGDYIVCFGRPGRPDPALRRKDTPL